ncbi:PFU-domain-containing protein [Serendipita vermifera]|nr:PFU-domain-containing protein [Serendipita vermifera]
MPYRLSASLNGHSQDVRGVVSPTTGLVLSASRDSTAIAWSKGQSDSPFAISATYKPSEGFINSIAYMPPSSEAPQGYVITGGQDGIVNIFVLGSPSTEPAYSLLGHTANVCALASSPTGTLVSGSWDSTARVWREFKELYVLEGHTQSVWAVLPIDETRTLTGSADKTIKLWNQHKEVNRFHGHNDAVRGLVIVPDIGFASCSNDSEIRVWTLQGDLVYNLVGHTSFVYSLAILPSGEIVSSGEDRTVRVWKDGECWQTIVHPAISVWTVSTMPNGDIVSGCSDGIVRVFSESEERWAPADQLKLYDDTIANQALPTQQLGDVNKANLPGTEALSQPGKKDGQVIMVRNGNTVEAHQWDGMNKTWQKVGEVVDAVGSGRKQLFDGKEYDYVFDVDIKDGAPPLKLPYNANENTYQAAHRFLTKNDLPLSYIDEVANFIDKNTSAVRIGTVSDQYMDPYTGASRYVPRGSASAPAQAPTSYTPTSGPVNSANMDPFTGSGRGGDERQKVLPVLSCLPFKQANVPAMEKKIQELNQTVSSADENAALQPSELAAFQEMYQALSTNNLASLTASHVQTVSSIVDRWPSTQVFPVIDLLRLVLASSPSAFKSVENKQGIIQALFKAVQKDEAWESPLEKSRETNLLLVLRTVANMFQLPVGKVPASWTTDVMVNLQSIPGTVWTKAHLLPLATLLLNYSCVIHRSSNAALDQEKHLALIEMVLGNSNSDQETLYRALIAFGNVACSVAKPKLGKATAGWLRLTSAVSKKSTEKRTQDLVHEVQSLIL